SCVLCRSLPRSTLFPYTTLFRSVWFNSKFTDHTLFHRVPFQQHFSHAQSWIHRKFRLLPDHLYRTVSAVRSQRLSIQKDFPLIRSEEHTSELQSRFDLVCRLLLE